MGLTNDERSSLVELRLEKSKKIYSRSRTNAFYGIMGFGS